MISKVEEAGRRAPCLERRESAGCQFALWGGAGVRYSERSVWYIEGGGLSDSEVVAGSVCMGEASGVSWRR